jgi:hypothetical protein
MITFTIADYSEQDTQVEVTYFNEENFVHKRFVNIPHLSDGTIDNDYFNEILEGQRLNVINKERIGLISFKDPDLVVNNEESVGIQTN